ncbi:MAG: formate dehydrogenase subunit delta [Pseudomonadota bacterium]
MNIDHLVTMANQIGTFFLSYPDQDEAKAEIVGHLQRYWAPRMRKQLLEFVEMEQGAGLAPLVLEAIQAHRVRLMPLAA